MDTGTWLIINILGIACCAPLLALSLRDKQAGWSAFWAVCLTLNITSAAANTVALS